MRSERTTDETLTDKALVLALLARVHRVNCDAGRKPTLGDRLKIQKLCFLTAYPLFQQRVKALNLTFFTYRWGPFTKDLYEIEADFEEAKILNRQGRQYSLTDGGSGLGQAVYDSLNEDSSNKALVTEIDRVVAKFSKSTTEELIKHTHEMKVRPVGWANERVLETLPLHLDLTRILEADEATSSVEVDPGWLDSLGIVLQKSNR